MTVFDLRTAHFYLLHSPLLHSPLLSSILLSSILLNHSLLSSSVLTGLHRCCTSPRCHGQGLSLSSSLFLSFSACLCHSLHLFNTFSACLCVSVSVLNSYQIEEVGCILNYSLCGNYSNLLEAIVLSNNFSVLFYF